MRCINGGEALFKTAADGQLIEMEGVLPEGPVIGRTSQNYQEDGWKWPGDRNMASVQALIEALEHNTEPQGSGDNGHRVLEMAIALRQSHRRGCVPVALPLSDRSLRIIPTPSRMYNKKPILGSEAYMAQVRSGWKEE